MTILSKKKIVNQGKQDQETSDSNVLHPSSLSTSHSNHPHQLSNSSPSQGSEQLYSPGQLSPGHRWSPHRGEENPLSNEAAHDSSSRKRHRASPHRVVRSKRERNQPSSPSSSQGSSETTLNTTPDSTGEDADPSGYNSGDEYNMENDEQLSECHWLEKDRMFAKKMQKKGFVIKEMGRDGACLFRAVADQVYGDQEMHSVVRKHCMDYIERNRDHFSQYMTEDFSMYVDRKRKASVHGNHIELQALCEMYNRPVQVFSYKTEPINIFHGMMKTENEPIRLSYEQGCHYNSIVDPHKPSIGVGLGLPGFTPGLADQSSMADALMQSENFEIEQAMLKDKLFASDLEATNLAIEEQVARASYMEWVWETEKRNKTKLTSSTASATVTSGSPRSRSLGGSPVPLDNIRNSPRSSPKAGPSSSNDNNDYFHCYPDLSLPGTSKGTEATSSNSSSQYFIFEGPSTSSFQGPSSHTNQRSNWMPDSNSASHTAGASQPILSRSASASQGQRSPDVQCSTSTKTNEGNIRSRLHQFGMNKNQDHRAFRCISSDEIEKMMKRICNSRSSSSSPKSHSGSSD